MAQVTRVYDLNDMTELLTELTSTMRHAQIFIQSRQIMHPDGQMQYREFLALLERLLERANEQLAAERTNASVERSN